MVRTKNPSFSSGENVPEEGEYQNLHDSLLTDDPIDPNTLPELHGDKYISPSKKKLLFVKRKISFEKQAKKREDIKLQLRDKESDPTMLPLEKSRRRL